MQSGLDNLDSLDLLLDVDLDFGEEVAEIPSTLDGSANLLDSITALLDSIGTLPDVEVQEVLDIEDYMECEPNNSYMDSSGRLQVHQDIAMPETCIMISHKRSPQLIVSIMQSLMRYFKPTEVSQVLGPICIEYEGEFIVSNENVEYNADLLSTLLNLNESFDEDVKVRLRGKTYTVYDNELLSKFLCT